MAGLINWKKATIPSENPDSLHIYAGIDSADGILYTKNNAGVVTKFPTLLTVLNAVLTGISFASSTAILATDTILIAMGKLQAQITTLFSRNINNGYGITGGGNLAADRTLAVSLSAIEDKNSTAFVTSSATDVAITGLSETPAAGTYLVMSCIDGTFDTNNRVSTISLYIGSTQVTSSERSTSHFDQTRQMPNGTQGILTVNGSQEITTRVRVSGGQLTSANKSMILVRVA